MSITKSAIKRFIFRDKCAETQKLIGVKRKFSEESSCSSKMAGHADHQISDLVVFKNLLHDFSTGKFVPDGSADFWDHRFWVELCLEFNERSGKSYSWNAMLDMGRDLQSEFCSQRAVRLTPSYLYFFLGKM